MPTSRCNLTGNSTLVDALRPQDAWGTEIALALLSASLKRKIVTITPGATWIVSVGSDEAPPLFLRLQNRHYDPLQQIPTAAMLEAVISMLNLLSLTT